MSTKDKMPCYLDRVSLLVPQDVYGEWLGEGEYAGGLKGLSRTINCIPMNIIIGGKVVTPPPPPIWFLEFLSALFNFSSCMHIS